MLTEIMAASLLFWASFCALLGLIVGSFLNVVISRLPRMMEAEWKRECSALLEVPAPEEAPLTLARPPSRCPHCGHRIRVWENIPLLSWLLLRGRCSQCGTGISLQYPLVELAAGVLAAWAAMHYGYGLQAAAAIALGWALLALAVIDLKTQLLPDSIVLPLLWAGLLVNFTATFVPLHAAVAGAMAGYLSLWLVYHGFRLLTGKEGMGYGDFKLFAALGAWMGWQLLPWVILAASVVGAVSGIGLMLSKRLEQGKPMPFGPFLAAAGWLVMLYGEAFANWYLGTVQ